jgi:hypothetical protein
MRLTRSFLGVVAVAAVIVVGQAIPAGAARGVTSPTTPANSSVAVQPTYHSQYSQDYGDPRCPSNVDESKNKCFTYQFAIGIVSNNAWGAINPQAGCGVQDNCTYGTDAPCPADEGQGPLAYQARFYQWIVPSDGSQPWQDIRYSAIVVLNPCVYRLITPHRA